MAHQPWKLNKSEIIHIYKSNNKLCNWSLNEFVHASVILFYFHKLASITESLDINIVNPKIYLESNQDYEVLRYNEDKETEFQRFLKKRDQKGNAY